MQLTVKCNVNEMQGTQKNGRIVNRATYEKTYSSQHRSILCIAALIYLL